MSEDDTLDMYEIQRRRIKKVNSASSWINLMHLLQKLGLEIIDEDKASFKQVVELNNGVWERVPLYIEGNEDD